MTNNQFRRSTVREGVRSVYYTMRQPRSALGPGRMRPRALFRWTNLLFLVVGAAAAPGPSTVWSAVPEIVARVNGEAVTRAEWQRMLADHLVRQQLQRELGVQDPDRKELA